MSLTNPYSTKTAGVTTITAAETNAAGAAIAKAVDGVGGGVYTPSAAVELNGSYSAPGLKSDAIGNSTFQGKLQFATTSNAGVGLVRRVNTTAVDGTAAVTIDTSSDIYVFGTPTAARTITLRITTAPIPVTGQEISIIRSDVGGFAYTIINETLGTTVQILGSATWGALKVFFNGTKWLVLATTDTAGVGTGGKP